MASFWKWGYLELCSGLLQHQRILQCSFSPLPPPPHHPQNKPYPFPCWKILPTPLGRWIDWFVFPISPNLSGQANSSRISLSPHTILCSRTVGFHLKWSLVKMCPTLVPLLLLVLPLWPNSMMDPERYVKWLKKRLNAETFYHDLLPFWYHFVVETNCAFYWESQDSVLL